MVRIRKSVLMVTCVVAALVMVGCDGQNEEQASRMAGNLTTTLVGGLVAGQDVKTGLTTIPEHTDGAAGLGTEGAQLFDAFDGIVRVGSTLSGEGPKEASVDTSALDASDFTRTEQAVSSCRPITPAVWSEAVVCIPGYSGTGDNWSAFVAYLHEHGITNTIAVSFASRGMGKTLEEYAAMVRDVIREKGKGKIETVYLVGHSTGGLIARELIRQNEVVGEFEVPVAITLGTPHHGTYYLTASTSPDGLVTARRQMHPDSDFIDTLEREGIPSGTDLFSWWAVGDGIIVPNESSVVTGAVNYRLEGLSMLSHVALLQEPRILEGSYRILCGTPPAPVGPQKNDGAATQQRVAVSKVSHATTFFSDTY